MTENLDMSAQYHTKGVHYDTCHYGPFRAYGEAGFEPYE
jgi:hypothetical protein